MRGRVLLLCAVATLLALLATASAAAAPTRAVLYDCQPLLLTLGPEQQQRKHPYLRAASSIVRLPDAHTYAVVQDDVGYIGLVTVDPGKEGGWVTRVQQKVSLPPSDSSQNRHFDHYTLTKKIKADIEAAVVVPGVNGTQWLLAFSSGSKDVFRSMVFIVPIKALLSPSSHACMDTVVVPRDSYWATRTPQVCTNAGPVAYGVDAVDFFEKLKTDLPRFGGRRLNIEGVVHLTSQPDAPESVLRIFQRMNGQNHGLPGTSVDVNWAHLRGYLSHELSKEGLDVPGLSESDGLDASESFDTPPGPFHLKEYPLGGSGDALGLGLTDAACIGEWLVAPLVAEDSSDVISDGAISRTALYVEHMGSAIDGVGDDHAMNKGRGVVVPLLCSLGGGSGEVEGPCLKKVEGIAEGPGEEKSYMLAVVDADDPNTPSEVCKLRLSF